ncbi:MAG: hypothetical protein IPH36_19555 [Saprospiraceae bacterium]|nr:hypothetical protein [Saprospiraceae bacterium]
MEDEVGLFWHQKFMGCINKKGRLINKSAFFFAKYYLLKLDITFETDS